MKNSPLFLIRSLFIAILILFSFSSAQIDPEQTVNPANGDMVLQLPLGVVKGINGQNFPLTLNYKAGIPYHSQASEVGLGFSLGTGGSIRCGCRTG
jgi:hypothetical protein